jgi:hypothetical protein
MSSLQLFSNNAVTLLASPISIGATSLTVMSGHGAMFPQPSAPGEYFLVTLEDQNSTIREIIRVTARAGDTFSGILRAQEGTIPRAWGASIGNDTLVDHRITADTMKRAMELPEPPTLGELADVDLSTAPTVGQTIKWNGVAWVPGNDNGGGGGGFVPGSIDAFTDVDTSTTPPTLGQVLTWNGTNWVPQTVSGVAWINGQNTLSVPVAPLSMAQLATTVYSPLQRTFKFLITLIAPSLPDVCSFEVLAVVRGDVAAMSETVDWTRTGRVGRQLQGSVMVSLNPTINTLTVSFTNNEPFALVAHVTTIQHLA